MFRNFFSRAPDPAEMDLGTFANAVRRGHATVVDVREPHEFVAGHIRARGATLRGQAFRRRNVAVAHGRRSGHNLREEAHGVQHHPPDGRRL
jgi:rhodanese-related sulfurtransferase